MTFVRHTTGPDQTITRGTQYSGVVVGVQGVDGDGEGTAETILYDIEVTGSNGNAIRFNGVKPSQLRPSGIKIMAARAGDLCLSVVRRGNVFSFTVFEFPAFGCEETP